MIRNSYCRVTVGGNEVSILDAEVSEGFRQTTSRCSFSVSDITGLNLNQLVTIEMGYAGDHAQIFQGYVDEIVETRMPGTYQLEGRDILKRAIEHFLVSEDIYSPWARADIPAECLVQELLLECGITGYSGAGTDYTFGVNNNPAEFNLMSVWDAIKQICNIIAYNCWAENGTVYFDRVFPVPSGIPVATLNVGDVGSIISINYTYNTDNLRNKVVVFGKSPIYAEAHEESPYLPAGFYKTAIVSSELIGSQSMADDSAKYNLELYNKLTETLSVEIEGNHNIRCRDTVRVTEPFTGMSAADWFVFAVSHRFDAQGYKTSLNLSR